MHQVGLFYLQDYREMHDQQYIKKLHMSSFSDVFLLQRDKELKKCSVRKSTCYFTLKNIITTKF